MTYQKNTVNFDAIKPNKINGAQDDCKPRRGYNGAHVVKKVGADGVPVMYIYEWRGGPRIAKVTNSNDIEAAIHSGMWDRRKSHITPILRAARNRAQQRGLVFDLDDEWLKTKILTCDDKCEITGLPFDYSQKPTELSKNPNRPSIDRINSQVGYTKDNCRIVLACVNIAMNEWGSSQLQRIIDAIRPSADRAWLDMRTAPVDGQLVDALARYPEKNQTHPMYVKFVSGAWYQPCNDILQRVIPLGWRPISIGVYPDHR